MPKNLILILVGVLLLGGLYASWGTLSSIWALASTGTALMTPEKKDDAPVAASSVSPRQPPLSGMAAKLSNHLMVLNNGLPHSMDMSKLAGVKYWAFYYSASWCPPCRAFTPDLVGFYREFKPSHPNFELIFVNDDRNENDMLNYMKNDDMPWPAVWYSDLDNPDLNPRKYCGSGIPCLVLVDDDGHVISDTFRSGEYTDPHQVIADIKADVQ